jgi:uncharacterized protein with PIN domain
MPENQYLICPFCENRCIEAKPEFARCPECYAELEIDDRLECIFADPEKLRLPAKGIVCPLCGLIQNDGVKVCLYCGIGINTAVQ